MASPDVIVHLSFHHSLFQLVTKDSIEGKGEPEIVYGNVKGSKKSLSRKLSDKKTSETA